MTFNIVVDRYWGRAKLNKFRSSKEVKWDNPVRIAVGRACCWPRVLLLVGRATGRRLSCCLLEVFFKAGGTFSVVMDGDDAIAFHKELTHFPDPLRRCSPSTMRSRGCAIPLARVSFLLRTAWRVLSVRFTV